MIFDEEINQTVRHLKPSGIRRFFDIAATRKGVISLGVGEPDFVTPWHIREEAIHAIEKGKTSTMRAGDCKELEDFFSLFESENKEGLSDDIQEVAEESGLGDNIPKSLLKLYYIFFDRLPIIYIYSV